MTVTAPPLRDLQGKSGVDLGAGEARARAVEAAGGGWCVRDVNAVVLSEGGSAGSCGRAFARSELVGVLEGEGGWSVSSLSSCRSGWVCDRCAVVHEGLARERHLWWVRGWLGGGGRVLHVTLTVGHSRSDSLASLLGVLEGCRRSFLESAVVAGLGVVEWVRVLHVRWSVSGWHPHAHVQLFVPAGVELPEAGVVEGLLWPAWRDRVRRRHHSVSRGGFRARFVDSVVGALYPWLWAPEGGGVSDRYHPDRYGGFDPDDPRDPLHPGFVGDDDGGVEDRGSVAVWGLAAAAGAGCGRSRGLWREFHSATKGRAVVSCSRGVSGAWREHVEALEAEAEAAELDGAGSEPEDDRELVGFIESRLWNKARFRRVGGRVSSCAEAGLRVGHGEGWEELARFWAVELGVRVRLESWEGFPVLRLVDRGGGRRGRVRGCRDLSGVGV